MPLWKAQPVGMFKINTDAALRFCDKVSGIDVVIRDSNGHAMASLCQNINANYHPQIAEALAILKGISWLRIPALCLLSWSRMRYLW